MAPAAAKQRSEALQEPCCGSGSSLVTLQGTQRTHEAPKKFRSAKPGASCGTCSSGNSMWKRCRSVLWLRKQQLQRLVTLHERTVALEAAVAAIGDAA